MRTHTIRLWTGQRPTGHELEDRIRRVLRIVRAERYRAVRDRNGHQVRMELDRVRNRVGLSGDHSAARPES
jgi:hypothetical protein